METKKFREVFKEEGETLTLLIKIKIEEKVFNQGASFTAKEGLEGINFHRLRYLDIGGEMTADNAFEIKGFYPQQ